MVIVNNPGDWGNVHWPLLQKAAGLIAAGLGGVAAGLLWRRTFPINKSLGGMFVLLAWMYRRRLFLRV